MEVEGRPPSKSGPKSIWRSPIAARVLRLRLAILEEKKKSGIRGPLKQRIRMTLNVHGPNVDNPKIPRTYVGDIDSLMAGTCDSIRMANHNMTRPSPVFEGHDEVGPGIPLLIKDDSQVVEADAKKAESVDEGYVLTVLELP